MLSIGSVYYLSSVKFKEYDCDSGLNYRPNTSYVPFFYLYFLFYVSILPPYFWWISQMVMFTLSTSSIVNHLMVVFLLCPGSHFVPLLEVHRSMTLFLCSMLLY